MTQVPNDPGLDCQPSVSYTPTNQYDILTEDGFATAMELQTKYSYEASKQMMEQVLQKMNEMRDQLSFRLDSYGTDLDNLADDLNNLRSFVSESLGRMDAINEKQNEKIHAICRHMNLSMDGYDYSNLVNQIVNRC